MAEKTFALNTTPHIINVGPHRFELEPEVIGAEFADAYAVLRRAQAAITAAGADIGAEELKAVNAGMRDFVSRFMLTESKQLFQTVRLPDRVLVQMLEFVAELYGGGAGTSENPTDAPGGPSSAS